MRPTSRKVFLEVIKAIGPEGDYEASIKYLEKMGRRKMAPWSRKQFIMYKKMFIRGSLNVKDL